MTDLPELLEITESPNDLLIPCGDGAVWIADPVLFCAKHDFEALLTDDRNLYGLRAGKWQLVGNAKPAVVQ